MDPATLRRRKRIRLPLQAYTEPGCPCLVTVATRARARIFADVRAADAAVRALTRHAALTAVPIYCYCVMPDHVHLVLGASISRDIVTFVGEFKNLAQRALWSIGIAGAVWQRGFHDHFVRRSEQLDRVIAYVLDNPVRAGLVTDSSEYPFSGVMAECP